MTSAAPGARYLLGPTPQRFAEIFPFHFAIDAGSCVVQVGRSLPRLCPDVTPGARLGALFRVVSGQAEPTFDSLARLGARLLLLEHLGTGIRLRGQMLPLDSGDVQMFLGSPWLTDPGDIERLGLSFGDFAIHDPMLDLLLVQQSQATGLADLRRMTERLSQQRGELREANQRLAASERESRTLALVAARTDNAVILTDADGRVLWVNAGFSRLTGYALDEVRGRTPGSLLQGRGTHPDTVQYMRERLAAGQGFSVEVLNYHRTGSPYWASMEVQPIRDPSGQLVNFMAIERDVTERRAAERRLGIAHEVSTILAGSPGQDAALPALLERVCTVLGWRVGMLWRPSETRRGLRVTAAWSDPSDPRRSYLEACRLAELPPGEGLPGEVWKQRTPLWFSDVTVPGDTPQALQAREDGLHGAFAFPVLVGGETWGILEFLSPHVEEPDQALLQFFVGLGSQIGQYLERGEVERRLFGQSELQRAILAGAGVAIISTDVSGIIRTFNPAAERLLGYPASELVGRQTPLLFHDPLELARRAQELTEALGRPVTAGLDALVAPSLPGGPDQREWTYVRHDGRRLPVWLSTTTLRDASGGAAGHLVIAADISERKRTEQELLRAKEAAEGADRSKSEFLATMSHEIRTPMNAILGMTSLLLDSRLEPAQEEMVRGAHSSGEALMRIIDDLLDFAKIEAQRVELQPEDVSLDSLLDGTVDLLRHTAHDKGLELSLVVDPRCPRRFRADAGRLRQVLLNLLGNAIKFTAHGEVVLAVSPLGDDRGGLAFEVSDTGIGLTTEQQARLFEPFVQAESTTARRFGGTGLGLAICKRLVSAMGGQISLRSEVGVGTTMRFTVPLERSTPTVVPEPREHALIGDPGESSRRGAIAALASLGVSATAVATELEVVRHLREVLRSDPPALLLLDRGMFGPSVRAALASLDEAPAARQPWLVLTGRAVENIPYAAPIGAGDQFVSKPVRRSQLEAVLKRLRRRSGALSISPPSDAAAAAAVEPAGVRVLIVEDNEINRRLALLMIGKLGLEADVATDGVEAVAAVRARSYDAILMDCHMPRLDGYDATRAIRRWEAEGGGGRRRIIALTASAMSGERERCAAAGMDDYVTKPVKLEALRAALEPLLVATSPD